MAFRPAQAPLGIITTPDLPRNHTARLTCLLALLGTLGAAPGAWAASYAAVTSDNVQDEPFHTDIQTGAAPVTATSISSYSSTTGSSGSQAYALSDTAGLHLTATAIATVNTSLQPVNVYAQSEAHAGFSDQFVLLAPGMTTGAAGTATVALGIAGSLSNIGPLGLPDWQGWGTYTKWEASLTLYGADQAGWSGWHSQFIDAANTFIEGTANFGTVYVTVPVTFGGIVQLNMSGRVEARAGAGTGLDGAAYFAAISDALLGNTIAWGGIVDLRDANGNAVTGFSAVSADTGFDYAGAYVDAVPEPESYAMMLVGLGLVGWMANRKRFADS
jgi:hypothetical protein